MSSEQFHNNVRLAREWEEFAKNPSGGDAHVLQCLVGMTGQVVEMLFATHKEMRELNARVDEILFHNGVVVVPRLANILAALKATNPDKRVVRDEAGNATSIEAVQ